MARIAKDVSNTRRKEILLVRQRTGRDHMETTFRKAGYLFYYAGEPRRVPSAASEIPGWGRKPVTITSKVAPPPLSPSSSKQISKSKSGGIGEEHEAVIRDNASDLVYQLQKIFARPMKFWNTCWQNNRDQPIFNYLHWMGILEAQKFEYEYMDCWHGLFTMHWGQSQKQIRFGEDNLLVTPRGDAYCDCQPAFLAASV
jgi:hypothetical protein